MSNQQFSSQSMSTNTTPMNSNIGKVVTGQLGAKIDFTQAAPSMRAPMQSSGFASPNQYPKESWQNYTSRPNSRWAQVHGGVMDRSGSSPVFKPFGAGS